MLIVPLNVPNPERRLAVLRLSDSGQGLRSLELQLQSIAHHLQATVLLRCVLYSRNSRSFS